MAILSIAAPGQGQDRGSGPGGGRRVGDRLSRGARPGLVPDDPGQRRGARGSRAGRRGLDRVPARRWDRRAISARRRSGPTAGSRRRRWPSGGTSIGFVAAPIRLPGVRRRFDTFGEPDPPRHPTGDRDHPGHRPARGGDPPPAVRTCASRSVRRSGRRRDDCHSQPGRQHARTAAASVHRHGARRSGSSTATPRGTIHHDWPIEQIAGRDRRPRRHRSGSTSRMRESAANGRGRGLLRDVFRFHPLAVEDALQETHVPKVDDWGDYLYLVFHVARLRPRDRPAPAPRARHLPRPQLPGDLPHRAAARSSTSTAANIERDPRDRLPPRGRPPALPLARAGRRPVLPAIEHLDERDRRRPERGLQHADARDRSGRSSGSSGRPSGCTGRSRPEREVLNRLARDAYEPIQAEHRVYFRDLYDHVVRDPRHLREPPRPDRRRARDLSVGRSRTGPTTS